MKCAIKRYGATGTLGVTFFHYVPPAPPTQEAPFTLCGKASDSPTLSKMWAPPGTAPVAAPPMLCGDCRSILLNARAREMLSESLALVEEAQHTLEKAAAACGGVALGGSIQNGRCARLASQVHALWRYLEYRFRPRHEKKVTLDYANAEPFLLWYERYGGDANVPIAYYVRSSMRMRGVVTDALQMRGQSR